MFKKYKKFKKKVLTPEAIRKKAKDNMSKLHPMVYSFLSIKSKEDSGNEFVVNSFNVINKNPEKLTDKWINSLNKWATGLAEKMSLKPPEIEVGNREDFVFKIHKIKAEGGGLGGVNLKNPIQSQIAYYKIFCIDENGWQYYFSSGRKMFFDIFKNMNVDTFTEDKKEYVISFSAAVSKHVDGMTFLRRPTKIKIVK